MHACDGRSLAELNRDQLGGKRVEWAPKRMSLRLCVRAVSETKLKTLNVIIDRGEKQGDIFLQFDFALSLN